MIRSPLGFLPVVAGLILAPVNGVQSQTALLSGRVLDASGVAVPNASVEVVGTFWRTSTDYNGLFHLQLPVRTWSLLVRQIGFLPDFQSVTMPSEPLTIRLQPQAISLKGITVTGQPNVAMSQTVSPSTVRQVPPLAEADIFRAIVMLPAVNQPNDLKGRIHLAGGSSDETGIELDGHPLQDPFHLLGVLGAFNIAALDRGDVLIHHVPIEKEGRLSGVIALKSRTSAVPRREVNIGLLSSGLTVVQPALFGGFSLLASGRITYLDKAIQAIGDQVRLGGDEVTLLGYHDATLRVHREWDNAKLEATMFNTRDRRSTSGAGSNPYTWGETLAGMRATRRAANWTVELRASVNRATGTLTASESQQPGISQQVSLRHDWISGVISATRAGKVSSSQLGLAIDAQNTSQLWQASPEDFFSPRAPRNFMGSESQVRPAGFFELSRALNAVFSATLGGRFVSLDGRVFPSPRTLLTAVLPRRSTLSFSIERRLQFSTEIEEPGEGSGKQPVFLLSAPRIADIGAISFDRDGGRSGDIHIVGFAKRYTDRTSLRGNPRAAENAGEAVSDFPEFDRIPGRGYGIATSFRREFQKRYLFQGSYTFQRISERTSDDYVPAPWDSPHALTVFGTSRVSRHWTLNIAGQFRSGAPITPVALRVFAPGTDNPVSSPFLQPRYLKGSRNSARLSSYRRIDLGGRREWKRGRTEIVFALQALNLFYRRNALENDWASIYCVEAGACEEARPARSGLPFIPSLGLEVRW